MALQPYPFLIPSGKNPQGLVEAVIDFLSKSENMETQLMIPDPEGNVCVIQGRARGGGYKQFLGLDKAITIRLDVMRGKRAITVEIGAAKWGDKGAALAAGWFVFWPLAVTSGVGIYQQKQLPNKILGVIQQYLDA